MRLGCIPHTRIESNKATKEFAFDLPRLESIFCGKDGRLNRKYFQELPLELKSVFFESNDLPIMHSAIVADSRNDDNQFLSQLHVSFLCLHNKMIGSTANKAEGLHDQETRFQTAKKHAIFNYQWLIINDFLKQICFREVYDFVLQQEAPLYREFFLTHSDTNWGTFPVPFEFSFAAIKGGLLNLHPNYNQMRINHKDTRSISQGIRANHIKDKFESILNSSDRFEMAKKYSLQGTGVKTAHRHKIVSQVYLPEQVSRLIR